MKKYCVLGHNIAYSLSPKLHNKIFSVLKEDSEYFICDTAPQDLESTVKRLMRECEGFNVTKPYKESVARILGAKQPVNTVKRDGSCTSTDPTGFITDYISAFGEPEGNILILGAGGAAKSVASSLTKHGKCNVYVYNRTFYKAEEMQKIYGVTAIKTLDKSFDSVINCTSLGFCGEQAAPENLSFENVKFAYDLIYSPPETPFLIRAKNSGAKTSNGLGMLVYQAIAAQEFWRGKQFSEYEKTTLYNAVIKDLI